MEINVTYCLPLRPFICLSNVNGWYGLALILFLKCFIVVIASCSSANWSFERNNTSIKNNITATETDHQKIPSSIDPVTHSVEKLSVSNSNLAQKNFTLNSQNIDKEVFSQLPTHIQEEILAEANQQRQSVRF